MNPYVRERINRKLDTLNDERLYQVLDYVEFLETKYAEKPAATVNVLKRFAEGVEDKLRAGGMAVSTITEAMGFMNRAVGVLNGVAEKTLSVATDVVNVAKSAVDQVGAPTPTAGPPVAVVPAPEAAPVAPPAAPPAPRPLTPPGAAA